MSRPIIRRLKPEEEELLRKREEFAAVRGALAEGEMELLDLRNQLAAFEGRYLRQVGTLYAELDEWKARISELQARLNPSAASAAQAEEARERSTSSKAVAIFIPPNLDLRSSSLQNIGISLHKSLWGLFCANRRSTAMPIN
jgi:chromosome segregation ATPase